MHFPDGLAGKLVKNPPASPEDIRDMGSVPRLGRCAGVGNGNPLQYSCLENPCTEKPSRLGNRSCGYLQWKIIDHRRNRSIEVLMQHMGVC